MPEAETGKAVQVLDLLLEYYGEQGERWTRDRYDDGDGRRCLVGALSYLRGKHRVPSESAECFLHEAMKQGRPHRRGGLAVGRAEFAPVLIGGEGGHLIFELGEVADMMLTARLPI